jgi:competence protein ComEA
VLLLGALVFVGWWWWSGDHGEEVPVTSETSQGLVLDSVTDIGGTSTAPTSEVVVHVAGAVEKPGLIRLPSGSRVADAVDAAGGAVRARDLDSVNLARILVDGEQIYVGKAKDENGSMGINVNSASAKELEELPGVGPVLAQRIIDWRTANGPFMSVDDLNSVPGIGDSVFAQIKPLATV